MTCGVGIGGSIEDIYSLYRRTDQRDEGMVFGRVEVRKRTRQRKEMTLQEGEP